MNRVLWVGTILCMCGMSLSCTVSHPPEYIKLSEVQTPMTLQATPWKMYGIAPHSWDLPDGRKARIGNRNIAIQRFPGGIMDPSVDFTVLLEGSPHLSLTCAVHPKADGIPSTRFGCWSNHPDHPSSFWFNPTPVCVRHTADLVLDPGCWTGTLRTPNTEYIVQFAYLEATQSVIDRVTWTSKETGQTHQAADLVAETTMDLYHPGREDIDRDRLAVYALALHQYIHVIFSD